MAYGWIVLAGLGVATLWACWMVLKALNAPSQPFGIGGYGRGSEAEKQDRMHPKAS